MVSPVLHVWPGRMEFWAKAHLGFGRAGNGDALGTTYLLGGFVGELHACCQWHQILCVSPLQAVRPATMASTVIPLGVTSFVKALLKNLLCLIPRVVTFATVDFWWSSSLCLYMPMFYSQWLSCSIRPCCCRLAFIADALPLLSLSWWMLGHHWFLWRMLCHRCHWPSLWHMLLLPCVPWSFPCGCFAAVAVFPSSPADAWSSMESLANALSSFFKWMLWHQGMV